MKILIIKPSSFGDIVQANPVATALKQSFPDCSICWLVFDKFATVIELFTNIDNKVIWNRSGGLKDFFSVASKLRKMNFDIVIDLQGLFRTALLARLSGAKRIVGVPGMKELSWLLVNEVFSESAKLNAVIRNLETVRFLTGKKFHPEFKIALKDDTVKLCKEKFSFLKGDSEQKIIGVVASARGVGKEWNLNNYTAVISSLINKYQNIKIILLGLDNKLTFENDKVINFQRKTTISELAYLLKECSLVLGGDTGPMHLASALGLKVVMLFGSSDVNETAPIANNAVILHKILPCSPCRGRAKCNDLKCINDITSKEVLSVIASSCELK